MTENRKKVKISTILLFGAIIAFVLILPTVNKGYSMMVINISLIYCIAAFGISIMYGLGGQLAFSTVTFMGVGAYTVANLCSGRLGFTINSLCALFIAVLIGAVLSFLTGLILLKLKGTYFSFATIGLVEVAWAVYQNYKPLSGGPDGIPNIATLQFFGWSPSNYNQWFYVLVGTVIVIGLLVERIRRTQLGRSLSAIRDNEIAALSLGINVYFSKVIAFTIAGILAAAAGALYAMHGKYISAEMFNFECATSYIIMAMLGGANDTCGIFLGSFLITMLPEWLRSMKNYLQLLYGVGIVLLMIFMPDGLAGLVKRIIGKYRHAMNAKKGGKGGLHEANIET